MNDLQAMTRPKPRHYHAPAVRLRCRAAYVNGEATLPQLAANEAIPLRTIRDWCFNGKWSAAREKRLTAVLESERPTVCEPAVAGDLSGSLHTRAREYERHLVRLRTQLAGETDPQKIDRLCAAIGRLEDVYCRYAGIPLPGSRKPAKEPVKKECREVMPL